MGPEQSSAVVLAEVHFPFIPVQVKELLAQVQQASQVRNVTVLGTLVLCAGRRRREPGPLPGGLGALFSRALAAAVSREGSKSWSCKATRRQGAAPLPRLRGQVMLVFYDQRKVLLSRLHPPAGPCPSARPGMPQPA